ncbi:MAG: hypothetical protein P8X64_12050 [Anaerolineales bacterium]|jgi:hypothetical protein
MPEAENPIGRVTRCSTQEFTGAVRPSALGLPRFGVFCQAQDSSGDLDIIGVIHNIRVEDDPLARQMAALEELPAEQLADAQQNRQAPVEFNALTVGYRQAGSSLHGLPPQPPLTLAPVRLLSEQELIQFTERVDFARLILARTDIPAEQLLAAALRIAAQAREQERRERYLLQAGRSIARLLAGDLPRLEAVLGALRPAAENGA